VSTAAYAGEKMSDACASDACAVLCGGFTHKIKKHRRLRSPTKTRLISEFCAPIARFRDRNL
jgi:hypothetical protein